MIKDSVFRQKLQEAGATNGMFALYQQYLDTGNKLGQERMLRQFRRIQSEKLKSDRDKLACLDYMIAKVENM